MSSNNGNLDEIKLAVALSDEIYRRADSDFGVKADDDLGVSVALGDVETIPTRNGGVLQRIDDYFYGMDTGFVGRVVKKGDVYYVVYRGTDMSGGLDGSTLATIFGGSPSSQVDAFDFTKANFPLALGRTGRTQLDDALALYDAAAAQVGSSKVVVVGQSLGGGLAGLVSALRGVDGYGFDPAPFKSQLRVEAQVLAIASIEQQYSLGDYSAWNALSIDEKISLVNSGSLFRAPVAAVLWASVSDDTDQRLSADPGRKIRLRPDEWKSGEHLWIVDVAGEPNAIAGSLKQLAEGPFKGKAVRFVMADGPSAALVALLHDLLASATKSEGDRV